MLFVNIVKLLLCFWPVEQLRVNILLLEVENG